MIDIISDFQSPGQPASASMEAWAQIALEGVVGDIAIRVIDAEEMQSLNLQFANKPKPTNVLSFPAETNSEFPDAFAAIANEGDPDFDKALQGLSALILLGDIAICAPVVEAEALAQGKSPASHYAHMIVHGVLHLRGYDHIDDQDAELMEERERVLLAQMGFDDPYFQDLYFQEQGDADKPKSALSDTSVVSQND